MKRLVLIGPGNIAKFHVDALKLFDFDIVGCISRIGSESSNKFMSTYGKNQTEYFSTLDSILKNLDSWDAALICCPSKDQLYYIDALFLSGKPILVEKPISTSLNNLEKYKNNKNIMVAFNRRYYESVDKFKSFINTEKDFFVNVNIPESSLSVNQKSPSNFLPNGVYENSIHVFDLINYMFNNVKWNNTLSRSSNKSNFISAHGICNETTPINMNIMIDSPENFSISANFSDHKIELKPIEIFRHFYGFKVDEPTDLIPIRRYSPRVTEELYSESNNNCKPGFYRQAKTFADLCEGKKNITFPSIIDAYNAIKSIDGISNLLKAT